MTKLCGIYCITHIASGRKYVGQSVDIEKRLKKHAAGQSKSMLSNAISKFTPAAFSFETIELCDRSKLNERETHWIAKFGCFCPKGFNLTTGGGQFEFSESTKQKMTASKLLQTPETRAKLSAARKGKKLSPEVVANMAKAHIGTKRSDETKQKMSESRQSWTQEQKLNRLLALRESMKNPDVRAKMKIIANSRDDQYRQKMSESLKARDPIYREKLSKALKGRTFSEESRAKISNSLLGKKPSDETRMKMALAQRGKKQSPERIAKAIAAKAANRLLRQNALAFIPLASLR